MFKRLVWFTLGASAGVAGVKRVERELAARRARLAPDSLARDAAAAANRGADRFRAAVADGRSEMRRVSDALQASHDPARRRRSSPSRTDH